MEVARSPDRPDPAQPLKLQGVTEIVDNGIVIRCKFTSTPQQPSWVQRESLKRIIAAFAANGIEFASNAVTFQSGMPGDDTQLKAAAAQASPPPAPPPIQRVG